MYFTLSPPSQPPGTRSLYMSLHGLTRLNERQGLRNADRRAKLPACHAAAPPHYEISVVTFEPALLCLNEYALNGLTLVDSGVSVLCARQDQMHPSFMRLVSLGGIGG